MSVGKCSIHYVLRDGSCTQHPALCNSSGAGKGEEHHLDTKIPLMGHRHGWEAEGVGGVKEERQESVAGGLQVLCLKQSAALMCLGRLHLGEIRIWKVFWDGGGNQHLGVCQHPCWIKG